MRIYATVACLLALFFGSMWLMGTATLDIVGAASTPIILMALGIVSAMIYATTFHGHEPGQTHDKAGTTSAVFTREPARHAETGLYAAARK